VQLRKIDAMLGPHRLGTCPACGSDVLPDPRSVRYRGDWYHVRCAFMERDPRHGARQHAVTH
jgi:hypothetical protein